MPRRIKPSHSMPLNLAVNMIAGHRHAERIGHPLNHSLTLQWRCVDALDDPAQAWRRTAVCARRWLQRRGLPWLVVWCHETGKFHSPHTHALIHLPDHATSDAFGKMLPHWAGAPSQPEDLFELEPADANAVWYLVKDLSKADAVKLGMPLALWHHYAPRRSLSPVTGKRAGASQNLSPKARSQAIWKPTLVPVNAAAA